MSIVFLRSEQPYRITAGLSSAPSTTATNYTLARQDAGACSITVTLAWVRTGEPTVAELALSGPLLPNVVYLLTVSGHGSSPVSYGAPTAAAPLDVEADDPEADAYGVDLAWMSDALDSRGDLPRRRGLACVRHDLAAVAVLSPGELFHLPEEGAAMSQSVNGPGAPAEQSRIGGALRRQWSRDHRVVQGGVSVQVEMGADGTVSALGNVKTKAVDRPLQVFVPETSPTVLGA